MRKDQGNVGIALVGAVAAFWIVNRLSEWVRQSFDAGTEIAEILPGFPGALAENLVHLSTNSTDLAAGGVAVAIVALIVFYKVGAKKNVRPGEEHGSATWGTRRDSKKLRDPDPSNELRLTQTEALSLDTRKTDRNLNVLVMGASGSRKTRSYVMPNLRRVNASTCITDPKGENERECADVLRGRGINVRTLNLVNLRESCQFNPFVYFSPDEPETSIAQLVDCIIENTSGTDQRGSDAFWERAERALLTALVAYVWATVPETATTEPSLPLVLDLQKGIEGSEENKDRRDSETDLKFAAARMVVGEWQADPHPEDDAAVMKVLDYACRQYRIYEQGPVETRLSVVISLGVRLAPLDMHDVRQILATDTAGIDRIGYEPTAMFLRIPDSHSTFRFVSAMFWQSVAEHLIYQADHEPNGRLPQVVHWFLDEFANIGKIPGFERVMATIRSRGLSASIIVQSHSQGKALFKDDWDGIVNNCDSKLFLGGDDVSTTEWISKLLGDETVAARTETRSYGMSSSSSTGTQPTKRSLMTPDEIGKLDNELALLKIRGLAPFKSKKLAVR